MGNETKTERWHVSPSGRPDRGGIVVTDAETHRHVATVFGDVGTVEYRAALVASAPALLEALRTIAFKPIGPAGATYEQVYEAIVEIARAALALAEGKQEASSDD